MNRRTIFCLTFSDKHLRRVEVTDSHHELLTILLLKHLFHVGQAVLHGNNWFPWFGCRKTGHRFPKLGNYQFFFSALKLLFRPNIIEATLEETKEKLFKWMDTTWELLIVGILSHQSFCQTWVKLTRFRIACTRSETVASCFAVIRFESWILNSEF